MEFCLAWLVPDVDGDGGVSCPGGLGPAGGLHVIGGRADVVSVVARVDPLQTQLGTVLVELVVTLLVPLQEKRENLEIGKLKVLRVVNQ